MEQVVPWAELGVVIKPVYAKAGNRRPAGAGGANAAYLFLQQWSACPEALSRTHRSLLTRREALHWIRFAFSLRLHFA
jgi:hypothetical protein